MSSSTRLIDLSLEEYSAALASKDSTPAGGSTAASVGAQGAALGAMVLWLSAGKLEGEPRGYLEATAEELEDLGDCLLELVDRDAQAYRSLVAGSKRGLQGAALEELAQAALDAPAEIAELGLIALGRMQLSQHQVSPHLRVDFSVALACLRTAVESGLEVAEVNLPGLLDAERQVGSRSALEDLRRGLQEFLKQLDSK